MDQKIGKNNKSVSSSREFILGIVDLAIKEITVKAWGNQVVYIRQLPAMERAILNQVTLPIQDSEKETDQIKIMALGCVYFLSDEKGKRIFEDSDAEAFEVKSASALTFIFTQGMRFSAMSDIDAEESKKK